MMVHFPWVIHPGGSLGRFARAEGGPLCSLTPPPPCVRIRLIGNPYPSFLWSNDLVLFFLRLVRRTKELP